MKLTSDIPARRGFGNARASRLIDVFAAVEWLTELARRPHPERGFATRSSPGPSNALERLVRPHFSAAAAHSQREIAEGNALVTQGTLTLTVQQAGGASVVLPTPLLPLPPGQSFRARVPFEVLLGSAATISAYTCRCHSPTCDRTNRSISNSMPFQTEFESNLCSDQRAT